MQRLGQSLNITTLPQHLFLPEELECIRLTKLRRKRQELEQKLRTVSNRISFRKKKENQQIQRQTRSAERIKMMNETINFKKFQELLKDELLQKKEFQIVKKAKQVENHRRSKQMRLRLVNQAMQDRKLSESESVRQNKRTYEEMIVAAKRNNELELRGKFQQALRGRERQQAKKKYYWFVEKRLSFQQNMMEEAKIYEKQIQDFHNKIKKLKASEQELRVKQEQAMEVLRCADQNYQLLKKA